jgi:hypothetical protein
MQHERFRLNLKKAITDKKISKRSEKGLTSGEKLNCEDLPGKLIGVS